MAEDFLVKDSAGNNYEAECWPGTSSWVDYFNPEAQEWYAGLYSLEKYVGSTNNLYIWNDMNEPAVFSTLDSTFAEDVQHYGGRSHKEVHNLYGLKQTQATKQGLLGRDPNKRPFILTRAHFAGSQRFSAMWTGDNNPSWEHLQISIPMILTESLGGMAFSGADVGGFTDNVAEDLLQRWYQLGAWYPFFRGHSGFDTEPREPYRYEEDVQERIRTALRIRYSHIPYLYTIFYEHEVTGDPIMRPLSYHYPEDPRVLDIDNQFLIGSDIMVAPVLEESVDSITTYFPGGADEYWYNVVDANVYLGTGNYPIDVTMDSIPYYYRGGSIILTIDNEVTCTADHDGKPYHMYVLLDSNGEASGNFYFDDWESFEYRNNDAYVYYRFEYADSRLSVIKINEQADYTDRNFMLSQIDVYRPASASSRAAIGRVEVKSAVKDIKMHNITATSTVLHRL